MGCLLLVVSVVVFLFYIQYIRWLLIIVAVLWMINSFLEGRKAYELEQQEKEKQDKKKSKGRPKNTLEK